MVTATNTSLYFKTEGLIGLEITNVRYTEVEIQRLVSVCTLYT